MKTSIGVIQLRGGQICFFCNQQGSMTYFQIEISIYTYTSYRYINILYYYTYIH